MSKQSTKDVRGLLNDKGADAVVELVRNAKLHQHSSKSAHADVPSPPECISKPDRPSCEGSEESSRLTEHRHERDAPSEAKPSIQLPGPGRPLSEFATELGQALVDSGVYSRKGMAFGVDAAAKKLIPVEPQWFRTWVEREVRLFKVKWNQKGEPEEFEHSMSLDIAKAVCASSQFLDELHEIRRFSPVRMPVMRENDEIELLPPGYDPESQILTDPEGCDYDFNLDPQEGIAILEDALGDFPFPDERSKAAAVAAMLTVFANDLLPSGSVLPAFVYVANAEGGGKTTLAMLAGVPYGAVTAKPAPTSEAEWAKRLLALVMSGQRLVIFDNVRGFLNAPSLEAYITAPRYGDRILGVSQEFEGDADAVILITGNRLRFTPDMRRRTIMIELFMSELRAEDRKFKKRLDTAAMIEMQSDLLAALWSLVRAWDDAGRPGPSRDNASFPRWAEVIGGIVEQAGYSCPTAPVELDQAGDTDTRDIAELATMMEPGGQMTFAELVDVCTEKGLFERFTTDVEHDGSLSRRAKSAFPKALHTYAGRTIAPGKVFHIEGKGHGRRYEVRSSAR